MINAVIEVLNGMYHWLPGGAIAPVIFCTLGFTWGMSRYTRSFRYIYYYYIEHGDVIWNMEGSTRRKAMIAVAKKYKLPGRDYFTPHGYVSGLGIIVLCTLLGIFVGTLWPLSLVVGILTIPNFVLRRIAREKRTKAVFKQKLEAESS